MDPTPQLGQLLKEGTARVGGWGEVERRKDVCGSVWRWKLKGTERIVQITTGGVKELVRRHCSNIELTDILRMNPFMLLISLPTNSFMKHMYSSFTPNLRESSERHGKRAREREGWGRMGKEEGS